MTTSQLRVFAIVAVAIGGMFTATGVARAGDVITAKVPFPFMVGNTELPAGSYVVAETAADPAVMRIASAAGEQVAFVVTTPQADRPDTTMKPQLVFHKVGNEFVLAGINADDGRQLEVTQAPSRR